ncbi:MAG TPA: NAD-binding protein [Burkholderiales bacterium]|nr:NAD-binding protein [Burkholderiales bacterium]
MKGSEESLAARMWRTFRWPIAVFAALHVVGAAGFWVISRGNASLVDCVYMVFITVASIGYAEIIDLSGSPGGRIFNMAIALVGIGTLGVMMSKLTVFIVEGRFDEVIRRRKMQDRIDHLRDHFVVCGVGRVGTNVAHELDVTERPFVAVEESPEAIANFRERYPDVLVLHGDASDDAVLERAGIARARGVFAITGDDGKNLLITLSAKQLNARARVVARCHEVRNIDKLKRIGADAIVSPDFTGGMRIASSMLRPVVVSFLDEMLRTDDKLRVEEIAMRAGAAPRPLVEIVPPSREYVLLAVRAGQAWQFNPREDFVLNPGDHVIVMATPEGRRILEKSLA